MKSSSSAVSVAGPIDSKTLGLTLPNEELLFDRTALATQSPGTVAAVVREATPFPFCEVTSNSLSNPSNVSWISAAGALREVEVYRSLGGGTLVDAGPHSASPSSKGELAQLALRSGINIIAGALPVPPTKKADNTSSSSSASSSDCGPSEEELRLELERQLLYGTPTEKFGHVRAGVIGTIQLSPRTFEIDAANSAESLYERRLLRAACLAQRNTNAPLFVSVSHWTPRDHWQPQQRQQQNHTAPPTGADVGERVVELLSSAGADLSRVVIFGLEPVQEKREPQLSLLARGLLLGFTVEPLPCWHAGHTRCVSGDAVVRHVASLALAAPVPPQQRATGAGAGAGAGAGVGAGAGTSSNPLSSSSLSQPPSACGGLDPSVYPYAHQLLLSSGVGSRAKLDAFGGPGLAFLPRLVLPRLDAELLKLLAIGTPSSCPSTAAPSSTFAAGSSSSPQTAVSFSTIMTATMERLLPWWTPPPVVELPKATTLCYWCEGPFTTDSDNQYSKFDFQYCSSKCLRSHMKTKWKVKE